MLLQLAALPTQERAGRATYDREAFGQRWRDTDANGCGQRDDALQAALVDVQVRPGTGGCVVMSGVLHDPYTGEQVHFVKSASGGGVDVDHVVPLAHSWQAGARDWDRGRRELFATDLTNLQPTAAAVNRAKGDAPVDAWLPPNTAYRCTYASRWVQVKDQWRLSVTVTERTFLQDLLSRCA